MLPTSGISELTIEGYLKIIRKRAIFICAFTVIISSIAAIVAFTTKPMYLATTSILIEQGLPTVTKFDEKDQVQNSFHDENFMTQFNIINSRMLADAVFNELQLGKTQEYENAKDPVEKLRKHIKVKIEPVKKSQIMIVQVSSVDPLRASDIANAITRIYTEKDIENRKREYRETGEFLDMQLADLAKKTQGSANALNLYMQENKIVAVPDIESKAKTFLEDLKTLRSKLEDDFSIASTRYRAKHPKMIILNNQLADISRKIDAETANLLALDQKLAKYRDLKTDAATNQQVYSSIMQSAKEKAVTENIGLTNIRVIDAAVPPKEPYMPKRKQDILMAMILSFLSAIGIVVLMEHMSLTVRMAEDIRAGIELPFLGYIPMVDGDGKDSPNLICYKNPTNVTCEYYRILRTSVIFASPENKPFETILVASALPGEGKSFVASNLAISFAQKGEDVILLDFDMHKPSVHTIFSADHKAGTGLSDYLTGRVDMNPIIKPTSIKNLSYISSGTSSPNPGNLLASEKVHLMLNELKSKFDRIILDSPPILNVSDAALLANIVDGVILVTKFEKTYLQDINESKERILSAKGTIIGVVINCIDRDIQGHHYYKYHYGMTPGKL